MSHTDIIKGLLSAMDMQEKRELEEFHIKQETAKHIWDTAKEAAQSYLNTERVIKPWGWYVDHYRTDHVVFKTIVVSPGKRISLQRHNLRGEVWYIQSGNGILKNGNTLGIVHAGVVTTISTGNVHRITNTGKDNLVINEMQCGVCKEDDIERLEDDYGR